MGLECHPDEYSTLELWQGTFTNPSESLQQDMLEASARLYHRQVARMQREYHTLLCQSIEQKRQELEDHFASHECTEEEMQAMVDAANASLRKLRGEMRGQLLRAMEKESEERQKRETKIRQFCEQP